MVFRSRFVPINVGEVAHPRLAAALVETAGSAAAGEAAVQFTSAKGQLRVGAGERLGSLSGVLGGVALVVIGRRATHGLGDDDPVAGAHLHWGLLLGRAVACGGGHDEAFGGEAELRGSGCRECW